MISNRHSVKLLSVLTVLFLTTCKPEKEEPKPLTAPVLTTMEAGDITAISALSGGAISSDGGSPVTARGIVWGVSHNPTLADSVSEEGTGIGSFTSDLTPLKYSTTYYVRAYATNSIGTTYGNEVTFNTKAAVPSDGLVGWWPFNGNANDESGNGNDGEVNEATLASDRMKFSNSAYWFDGINDNIDCGNNSILDMVNYETLTTSAWVRPETEVAQGAVISRYYQGSASNSSYGLIFGNGFYGLYGNGTNAYISTIETPTNWTNLIIEFHKTQGIAEIYKNGVLIGSGEINFNLNPTDVVVSIGRMYAGLPGAVNSNHFQGLIDDIAIYNRALTAEEIQKIYNGTGF